MLLRVELGTTIQDEGLVFRNQGMKHGGGGKLGMLCGSTPLLPEAPNCHLRSMPLKEKA